MKKIILSLLLITSFAGVLKAQETPPSGLKSVNAQFYINLTDSAIWHNKGTAPNGTIYGWERLARYKDLAVVPTSLTTTGNSGPATLISHVLNVPNYTLSGLGGQPQLSGTGFVKVSGTTISYDNSTYYKSGDSPTFATVNAATYNGAGTGLTGTGTGFTAGIAINWGTNGAIADLGSGILSPNATRVITFDNTDNVWKYQTITNFKTTLGINNGSTLTNSINGNSTTTTLAANSTKWKGYDFTFSNGPVSSYVMSYDGTGFALSGKTELSNFLTLANSATITATTSASANSIVMRDGSGRIATSDALYFGANFIVDGGASGWLFSNNGGPNGYLGTYAFRSSGLAELTGASFTGTVNSNVFSGYNYTADKASGGNVGFMRSGTLNAIIQDDGNKLGFYFGTGATLGATLSANGITATQGTFRSTGNNYTTIGTSDNTGGAGLRFSPNNTDTWTVGVTANSNDLQFSSGGFFGSSKMVLDGSGNLGVVGNGAFGGTVTAVQGRFNRNDDNIVLNNPTGNNSTVSFWNGGVYKAAFYYDNSTQLFGTTKGLSVQGALTTLGGATFGGGLTVAGDVNLINNTVNANLGLFGTIVLRSSGGGANIGSIAFGTVPLGSTSYNQTYQAANGVIALVAPFNSTSGTSATLTSTGVYVPQNAALTTYTLPTTAAVGDIIFINGKGSGLWKVAQNSGQTIHGASDTTTGTAGYIQATGRYNCVALRCVTANTDWVIQSSQGSLTIN
jgi:hypothetical protein